MNTLIKFTILCIVSLLVCCNTAQQASAVSYSKSNSTYYINSVVKGTLKIGDNSTLIVSGNGVFRNVTFSGRNIRIVVKENTQVFDNCNFTNATFSSCDLKASHFGLRSDMKTRPYNYSLKTVKIKTSERYGTDNTRAMAMLCQFLSNSHDIKISFDGEFYTSPSTMFLNINDATNLELYGPGTLIMGFRFVDCTNCYVHDLNFVGFHTVHDFPPIYYKEPISVNGTLYNKNNSYNCSADGLIACGLSDDGVKFLATKTNSNINRNHHVSRCHFEMRQNGVAVGTRSDKFIVRDVVVEDITFDHIYFQPVGLHVSGAKINNVRGGYCLQGLDISATSNNVTATNCSFDNCAFGPKQESNEQFRSMSHHNVIDGCTFGITDRYMMLDAAQYILNVSEGPVGDTFTVRNSTFNVKKNRLLTSVMTRAYRTLLENVTINVDVTLDRHSDSKYSMIEIFSVFGAPVFQPQLELNNVTVNIASGTKVYAVVSPHGGPGFHINANNLTVNGKGSVDTYFENATSIDARDCSFNIASKSLASSLDSFSATRCTAVAGTINFVNNTKEGASIKINDCNIKTQSLVNCRTTPRTLQVNNNNISISGSEAITGLNASKVNANMYKISGNIFSGNRSMQILSRSAQAKLPSLNRTNTVK